MKKLAKIIEERGDLGGYESFSENTFPFAEAFEFLRDEKNSISVFVIPSWANNLLLTLNCQGIYKWVDSVVNPSYICSIINED